MNASCAVLMLIAAFSQVGASPGNASSLADPTVTGQIHPLYEYDIPIYAEMEGLLTSVNVTDGARVSKGDLLAAIDQRHAEAAVKVAKLGVEAARLRAEDDIEWKYAKKAADVAKKVYEVDLDAVQRTPTAISPIQIEKDKLDWERAQLQIEKALKDQLLYSKEADVKQGELEAAQLNLGRRQILAPWDGEVQKLIRHQSEWVNPGDPVLHLVRYDVLQVEGQILSTAFDPVELQGRRVTVVVTLARGRQVKLPGQVVHVDQTVVQVNEEYGAYWVRAEIQNQREGEFWLVRPGLNAEMTIHVNQPAVEATSQRETVGPQ